MRVWGALTLSILVARVSAYVTLFQYTLHVHKSSDTNSLKSVQRIILIYRLSLQNDRLVTINKVDQHLRKKFFGRLEARNFLKIEFV